MAFQSTLPARGATLAAASSAAVLLISIHAPRTGSDAIVTPAAAAQYQFQSTLPARGATIFFSPRGFCPAFQSTLPARGATARLFSSTPPPNISIHAPRTGSDSRRAEQIRKGADFNPRSPHGERRAGLWGQTPEETISIHAPRTGSDASSNRALQTMRHFNPRSPHGERRLLSNRNAQIVTFQSTLPARGATCDVLAWLILGCISIHAPRTGSDAMASAICCVLPDFNPRSPHGERPGCDVGRECTLSISIHAPRTGSDDTFFRVASPRSEFQSTLPARGATMTCKRNFFCG